MDNLKINILEDNNHFARLKVENGDSMLINEKQYEQLRLHFVSECTHQTLLDTVDLMENIKKYMENRKGMWEKILNHRLMIKINYIKSLYSH